jgi:hypothetical protein
MDMSDSPMFSSGGTGAPTNALFASLGNSGGQYSFSQSAELAAQSSLVSQDTSSQVFLTPNNSEYVVLGNSLDDHVQANMREQSATQEICMSDINEDDETGAEPSKSEPAPWGILSSINPQYETVYLTKEDQPGSKTTGYLFGRHWECDVV